jgi:hypothetical protein
MVMLPPVLVEPATAVLPPVLVEPPVSYPPAPPVPLVVLSGSQLGSQTASPIREAHLIITLFMVPLLPIAPRLLPPSSRKGDALHVGSMSADRQWEKEPRSQTDKSANSRGRAIRVASGLGAAERLDRRLLEP